MSKELENLLNSGSIGIDRDRTLIEKALINHATNQTNRVLLLRILSKIEGRSFNELLNESSDMDIQNLNRHVDEHQKFVMP